VADHGDLNEISQDGNPPSDFGLGIRK
jgi:hypothetical protein